MLECYLEKKLPAGKAKPTASFILQKDYNKNNKKGKRKSKRKSKREKSGL